MSIEYKYEIISVNEAARCMEVVYSAEGHQTMHIGARIPFEGEGLEAVIRAYAPLAYWRDQKRAISLPTVGASGQLKEVTPPKILEGSEDQFADVFPTQPSGAINLVTIGE
jgi:hypothetical protein